MALGHGMEVMGLRAVEYNWTEAREEIWDLGKLRSSEWIGSWRQDVSICTVKNSSCDAPVLIQ